MPKLRENRLLAEYRRPAAELFADMFDHYMTTSNELAEKVNMTPPAVRRKKHHADRMTLEDYKVWCKVLDIPPQEAAETIYLYLRKGELKFENIGRKTGT